MAERIFGRDVSLGSKEKKALAGILARKEPDESRAFKVVLTAAERNSNGLKEKAPFPHSISHKNGNGGNHRRKREPRQRRCNRPPVFCRR